MKISKILLYFLWCITILFSLCIGQSPLQASDSFNDANYSISISEIDPMNRGGSIDPGVGALKQILKSVADVLLFTIPILASIALLIAGYFYIFSAGQSDMVGKAKVIIKWNLVAILVAFFSYAIIRIIATFFN